MQHTFIGEDDELVVALPSGEYLEIQFDGVDPIVYLVSIGGDTRTLLVPEAG